MQGIQNTAPEIVQAGDNVSDISLKIKLFNLRPEYRANVSLLKLKINDPNVTIDDLINDLTVVCENSDSDMRGTAEMDSRPTAFFGSGVNDAFGYQVPPKTLRNPGATHAEVNSVLRNYLYDNRSNLPIETTSATERLIAALSVQEIKDQRDSEQYAFNAMRGQRFRRDPSNSPCHLCGELGHWSRECPNVPPDSRPGPGRGYSRPAPQYGNYNRFNRDPQQYPGTPRGYGQQNVPLAPDTSGRQPIRPAGTSDSKHQPPASAHVAFDDILQYSGEENFAAFELSEEADYDALDKNFAGAALCEVEEIYPSPLIFLSNENSTSARASRTPATPFKKSALQDTQKKTCSDIDMKVVKNFEVVSLPAGDHITHLAEFCAGGTLAGLEAFLKAGYSIGRFTYFDTDHGAHHVAEWYLQGLQRQYPSLLPPSATESWDKMQQNVKVLTASDLKSLPPVTVGWFTPPCTRLGG